MSLAFFYLGDGLCKIANRLPQWDCLERPAGWAFGGYQWAMRMSLRLDRDGSVWEGPQ